MELNNCKKKLKVLFDKFFNEKLELNSYVRENLVKQLSDSGKRTENIFETPFFSDLLIYSLTNIDKGTISVKIFITQLVNLLVENELQFSKFVQLQGLAMVADKVLNRETVVSTPGLVTASFKICSSIISHSTGVYWTIQNRIWKDVLRQSLRDVPKIIAAEAYNFISKLVWKLDEYDEETALIDVLTCIVEPIKNNEYSNRVLDADREEAVYSSLLPFLEALKAVLGETDHIVRPNKVIPLLSQYLIIEPVLSILLNVTRDRNFSYVLSQIVFRISFAGILSTVVQNKEEHDLAREITVVYYNVFHELIRKQMPKECLHFTVTCLEFWSKFDKSIVPASFDRYGRTYVVEDQFITILLTPLLTNSCDRTRCHSMSTVESLKAFHYKLSTLTEEHIVKAAYSIHTILESDMGSMKQLAIGTVKQLFKMKSYLSGRQAGVLYQALFYNLQCYAVTDEMGTLTVGGNLITCPDDVKMLSLVLEAIKMLLKEHKINWYESVEIISLQNCLMNLLKQDILPSKQLLQALDLIDLSIQKFLSPDLALLIASRRGSTLNEIAAVMSSYMQHPEWEVRDSALHLLLSCTELAYVKYVPMQALLNENRVILVAAHMALYEEEAYVQTMALRCLAAATKIESLWSLALSAQPNLNMQLMYILKNNPESDVRKEAANVLLEFFTNQKTCPDFVQCLYNVMTSAALEDLDWEVQIVALHFWKVAILYQLTNRGMIDGKFPAVTFCKERRKIVTLNEHEIQKQLINIMNDLATTGCLVVLNKCLEEEYNVHVMEKAHSVAKELISILDCYKFQGIADTVNTLPFEEVTCKVDDIMDMAIDATQATEMLRNQVIESIVNTNQSDLICDLYDKYVEIKVNGMDEDVLFTSKLKRWMDPNEFLKSFREKDYSAIIEEKINWHSKPKSLDALLDEILELKKEEDIGVVKECD